ncbi:CMGC family protein kinase [Tritrichomonas foetus]|uniref:CMGC family protein kinase n=1 Tax=Tritrichomonas foetus TaxID=1144522 RepID=A0A1J4JTT1_9EUKA|nr:CMGC family protein kinase [Tritrichomonas foetus]|eukprot:OHT02527.1 CMGC family protein kinase [Tritrichomonas foetus]
MLCLSSLMNNNIMISLILMSFKNKSSRIFIILDSLDFYRRIKFKNFIYKLLKSNVIIHSINLIRSTLKTTFLHNHLLGRRKIFEIHILKMNIREIKNINSDFQIISTIGNGSYGCVYKAWKNSTRQVVALKKMFKNSSLKMIMSEAEILDKLKSENIVSLEEIIKSNDLYYMVYSYSEFDLFALIKTLPASFFSPERVSYFFRQILKALAYIHSFNIVHGDLKPDNIIVSCDNIVKICDFGLSKQLNPQNKKDTKLIYLFYRPLELLLGYDKYGTEVDIWSAGCILYEIIMKKPLFFADSERDQISEIIEKCGEPDENIFPGLSKRKTSGKNKNISEFLKSKLPREFIERGIIDLFEKMLTIDPKKRISASAALKHPFLNIPVKSLPIITHEEIHQTLPMKSKSRCLRDKIDRYQERKVDVAKLRPTMIPLPPILAD